MVALKMENSPFDNLNNFKDMPPLINLDTDDTAHFVYFGNGDMARITKTYYDHGDFRRFFLHPSNSMITRMGIAGREEEDKFYFKREDVFIRDVPLNKIIPLSIHPKFQRFLVLTDWNLKPLDPFQSKINELITENTRLQSERDSANETIKALLRKLRTFSKYEGMAFKESGEKLSGIVKDFNQFAPPMMPQQNQNQGAGFP